MGIYCGLILGGFSGYVADSPVLGWRFAFDVTASRAFCIRLPLLLFLRNAPKTTLASADSGSSKPSLATAAKELFTNGSFHLLVLYFTLPALAGWVVRDWMPAILKDQFDISQAWLESRRRCTSTSPRLAGRSSRLGGRPLDAAQADAAAFTSVPWDELVHSGAVWRGQRRRTRGGCLLPRALRSRLGCFDCNNMPILSQIVRPQLRATGYGL